MDADFERLRPQTVELAKAVSAGNKVEAMTIAALLAHSNTPLEIRPQESIYPAQEIRIQVRFEDAQNTVGPIALTVHSHWTVAHLKSEVFQKYGFHPLLQRWVFGGRLAKDCHSLHFYGIRTDGDHAFLYLLKVPSSSGDVAERHNAGTGARSPRTLPPPHNSGREVTPADGSLQDATAEWSCSACTLLNQPRAARCCVCDTPRQPDAPEQVRESFE
uniref:SHANK-associated RH domain interacting protein n=2 Tax=Petromyzon marinus TaxID=7757 RepID=S4R7E5_PETMA